MLSCSLFTFALSVEHYMLFKRGISRISKGFCCKLRESFLQVLLLLSRTCESK